MQLTEEKQRSLRLFLAFVVSLSLGLVVSFAWVQWGMQGRVSPGVQCGQAAVGGMTARELSQLLDRRARQVEKMRLHLKLDQLGLMRRGNDLGVTLDREGTLERLMAAGRRGHLGNRLGFFLSRLWTKYSVAPRFLQDRDRLRSSLEPWAAPVLSPARSPSISYHKGLRVDPGQVGTAINYEQLSLELRAQAESATDQTPTLPAVRIVQVPTTQNSPGVTEQLLKRRRAEAERLLAAPIELVTADSRHKMSLKPHMLGAALGSEVNAANQHFSLTLTMAQLRPALKDWLKDIERPAQNASYVFHPGQAPTIIASQVGVALDETAFIRELWRVSAEKERRMVLPLSEVEPQLTTSEAEGLGVLGLVSQFMTRHVCCQPRVDNIHTAAAKLDGTVLRPGEKFSLNQLLGPRTFRAGYKSAPTIVRGEMEDVFGGGISQLATTLFNAALRGGYKIIQRQPHSIYFSRYPEGHEATVSFPEPDLIFENDTQAGLLIRTEYSGTFIKVLIYGNNAGRVVTVEKSSRYNIVKPSIQYEADEHADPEKPKRLRAGQMGWSLVVSRKIKYPDGRVDQEKREVVYNPRAELLRVHPCTIPEGEKGHTGESCPEPPDEEREEQDEELSDDVYYETAEYDEEGG